MNCLNQFLAFQNFTNNYSPNDQKLFYTLLLKYRDTQLENYTPDLGYSNSDYHHVRPLTLKKTYSTCQFPQAKTKGHGRQVSKFTVVSNVAETERSYDPFKASRPQHLNGFRNDYDAKIIIHHTDAQSVGASASRYRSASGTSTTADRNRLLLPPPKSYASRSSLASSTRSRNSNPYVRATIGHKRGVSFSHLRKDSFGSQLSVEGKSLATAPRHSNNTEVTDCGGDTLRPVVDTPASTRYIRSRKARTTSQPLLSVAKRGRTSQIWNEDVRQLSTSLAKDCDEAFNRSSVISDISETSEGIGSNGSNQKTKQASLSTRPLPPPPTRTESIKNELLEARKQAELRKLYGDGDESPSYLDRMVSHIDRLMQPVSPTHSTADRRSSSAPVEAKKPTAGRLLPSIDESHEKDISPRRAKELAMYHDRQRRIEAKTGRIASAPEPRYARRDGFQDRFSRENSLSRDTIRVVDPTCPESPVKPPAPLTIRKKSSQGAPPPLVPRGPSKDKDTQSHKRRPSGLDLHQQYDASIKAETSPALPKIEEAKKDEDEFENESTTSTIVRKTSGWFKRSSKSGEDFRVSVIGSESLRSHSSHGTVKDPYTGPPSQQLDSAALPTLPKKKPFSLGRWFKKRNSKPDMTLGGMLCIPTSLLISEH
jgi:serine/threonine-protein kinase HSL1 (negative regulator of Swe1 kinase)